jgi:polyprenyl P-hydroxybenzoate/phenylacrylic acid decarboxylase-like protein
MAKRLVVGISGASGAPIAVELLRQLALISDVESHVVCTRGGEMTLMTECGLKPDDLRRMCAKLYDPDDIGAAIASGSFETMGMAIVPCSMKTAAGVVTGYADNLLLRAADVTLKERRRLVIVPRESPLSTVHLRNLTAASELGAVIIPPVPAYYDHPVTVDDINRHVAAKVLKMFGLQGEALPEWGGVERDN